MSIPDIRYSRITAAPSLFWSIIKSYEKTKTPILNGPKIQPLVMSG
jgi:hypothetical protein